MARVPVVISEPAIRTDRAVRGRAARSIRAVIDTDTGVDDALAIVLAANSPELEVAALTTVAGNAQVGECTRNVLLLAEHLWPTSPPRVARGAAAPVAGSLLTAPEVHGKDGLGGERGTLPSPSLSLSDLAAHELIPSVDDYTAAADRPPHGGQAEPTARHAETRGREDTALIATGPLTNLALALRADPNSLARYREIVIMGGALNVQGNTGPYAEFNFCVDPEAAETVLRSGLPVTIVPLDVTTTVELSRRRLEALAHWHRSVELIGQLKRDLAYRPSNTAAAAAESGRGEDRPLSPGDFLPVALARALDYYIEYQFQESGLQAGYMHDPTTLCAAFAPGLFGTTEIPIRVICDGPERGRSVVAEDDRAPIRVVVNVDRVAVLDLLTERVLQPLFG